jgi:Ca2+-binding EF-hand superfamily protein
MIRFPRKPLTAALGAAALTLGVSALAQSHSAHGGDITIADVEAKHAERVKEIDTDGNGLISQAEFLAAREGRRGGPGFHGPHRGSHHEGLRMGGPGRGHPGMHAPMGPALDIDPEALEDAVFTELDADRNGALSRAEFSREKVDAARGKAFRMAMFAELDANDDGSLSRDEMPDPVERLKALDADGDGKVSREERKANREKLRGAKKPAPDGTGA